MRNPTKKNFALWGLLALCPLLGGCEEEEAAPAADVAEAPAASEAQSTPLPAAEPVPASHEASPRPEVVIVAGGDVSFGRLRGNRLLREPERDDFASLRPLLDAADLRFVNLECTISDQGGETQSPLNKLVFTAPPVAAPALRRAGIELVSLANNHAWDYGREALLETFDRLDAEKIRYVGAGRTREEAYAPVVVEVGGRKIAFLAVTAIWNQELFPHPGKEHVADADEELLVKSVQEARAMRGVDWVVVSHHGGYEYVDEPHRQTQELLRAAVDAGADVVVGHHPHVIQRVEQHRGKPILYSVGNLLMRMKTGAAWTEYGMLARLTLRHDQAPGVEICPYRIYGLDPIPLGADDHRSIHEGIFRTRFERLLRQGALIDPDSAVILGQFGDDGCAPLEPTGGG